MAIQSRSSVSPTGSPDYGCAHSIASRRDHCREPNATSPFWSPDGRSLGFAADNQLKRVDLETGAVRLVVGGSALSGAWNRDGTILYQRELGGGLFRVSAD